jgi:hypothetical protein
VEAEWLGLTEKPWEKENEKLRIEMKNKYIERMIFILK